MTMLNILVSGDDDGGRTNVSLDELVEVTIECCRTKGPRNQLTGVPHWVFRECGALTTFAKLQRCDKDGE